VRKFLATFFLAVFAFNLGGYYLIFWGLQYHASQQLVKQADADAYASHDEVTFEIPVTLPYPVNQETFTRVNGTFEHGGEYYHVIKQKIIGDKLMLVCLRNHQQKKLNHALSGLIKIQHLPGDSRQALRVLAQLFKEYQFSEMPLLEPGRSWCAEIGLTGFTISSDPPYPDVAGPPPRLS
jgi:hypothetical protein